MTNNKWTEDWATRTMNSEHLDLLKDVPNSWMLRKCYCYQAEHKACQQIKTKIHDLFVHGETQSCQYWKDNFNDCKKWVSYQDIEAAKKIIAREEKRISERILPHYQNDVWEQRTSPPSEAEWTPPLPAELQKNMEKSLLGLEDSVENTFRKKVMAISSSQLPCNIL